MAEQYTYKPYPKMMYHATNTPVVVETLEEERYLDETFPDEWRGSPSDFGIITAPSVEQLQKTTHGFNFAQLKENQTKLVNKIPAEYVRPSSTEVEVENPDSEDASVDEDTEVEDEEGVEGTETEEEVSTSTGKRTRTKR